MSFLLIFKFSGKFKRWKGCTHPVFTAIALKMSLSFVFSFRWLDRNEDDGQIVRELVPAGDGLRLFSEYIQIKNKNKKGQHIFLIIA